MDPTTPRADAPPKQMSSRLATMKFMQRATNTNTSRFSTPSSEPTLKRRKTDHVTTPDSSTPTTPSTEPRYFADRVEIRAATKARALEEELAARKRAAQGFANNSIETQWILNVDFPATQQTATAVLGEEDMSVDEEDDEDDGDSHWSGSNGIQTYGGFKRKKPGTSGAVSNATNTSDRAKGNSDFDVDEDLSSDEGELDSAESDFGVARSHQKRKSNIAAIDYDNEASLAALDRVDLSKSSYARSKKAGLPHTGAKPDQKQAFARADTRPNQARNHPRDRRGDKHPKGKNKKSDKARRK